MSHRPDPRPCRPTPRPLAGRLLAWAVILPMLVLSMVSPGTMLRAAPDGGWQVVLCTPDGMVRMTMPQDAPGDPAADRMACDWALHGQAALGAPPAAIAAPPLRLAMTAPRIDTPLHLRRAQVLAPSARGPPLVM